MLMWKQAARMTDVGIEGVREELKKNWNAKLKFGIPKFELSICVTVKKQEIK